MEIPEFTLGSSFTDEQQTFFDTHGFIRFRGVASPEECDQLAMALDDLSDHWDSEGRDKVLGIPIQWGRKPDGKRYVQRYAYSSHYSPPIADFCTSERFEPVRRLCGDDARLAQTEKDGVVVNDFINDDGSNLEATGMAHRWASGFVLPDAARTHVERGVVSGRLPRSEGWRASHPRYPHPGVLVHGIREGILFRPPTRPERDRPDNETR
jgi:hypothetical protein